MLCNQGTEARTNAPVDRRKDKTGIGSAEKGEPSGETGRRSVAVCVGCAPSHKVVTHNMASPPMVTLITPPLPNRPTTAAFLDVYRYTGISLRLPALH